MTARAMKKAETINQTVGVEKPLRAAETDLDVLPGARTRLAAQTALATTATEPIGAALPMMARIVATKTAARCQALGADAHLMNPTFVRSSASTCSLRCS